MKLQFKRVRDIIDDYEQNELPTIKEELAACENARDYVYGKRYNKVSKTFTSPNSHQSHLFGQLEEIVNAIEDANLQAQPFDAFEDLYDAVKKIYESNGHPSAILAIYDTTLRIGYNHSPQILPEQYVYLYGTSKTGPLGGATRLYGQKWINLHFDKSNHRIETRWFHDKFPNLPSWEIESILCIYAGRFWRNMTY